MELLAQEEKLTPTKKQYQTKLEELAKAQGYLDLEQF